MDAISIFRKRPIIENSGCLYVRVPSPDRGYYSRERTFFYFHGQLGTEQTINERSEFAARVNSEIPGVPLCSIARAYNDRTTRTHNILRSRACMYILPLPWPSRSTRVDEAPRLFSRYHHLEHVSTTGHYGLIISITPHADRFYNQNRLARIFLSFSRQVYRVGA